MAGLCGFAVFCGQLLSALGYHGSVHPIFFFALSAVACWVIAYKDIRVSSILTLVLEGASVACITALAFVILFKHGFSVDTQAAVAERRQHAGHGPGRRRLHLLAGRFRGATTLGGEAKNPRRNVPRAVIASLLITGAFMVFMAYVEVGGTSNYGAAWTSAPLNYLAVAYNVSWFRIPVSIGAMVSFFSLSLSCLNAGSRIMYPMARHGIFSGHLGRAHATNRTPHVAVTVYIGLIFAVPAFLMIFTNPLTAFGDAGTLAAFGFLVAYYLITVAAPMYLKKLGELRRAQRGPGLCRGAVPAGADHRQLLPAAAVPGEPLPLHLPGVDGRRGRVALHRQPPPAGNPDRYRGRPGAGARAHRGDQRRSPRAPAATGHGLTPEQHGTASAVTEAQRTARPNFSRAGRPAPTLR